MSDLTANWPWPPATKKRRRSTRTHVLHRAAPSALRKGRVAAEAVYEAVERNPAHEFEFTVPKPPWHCPECGAVMMTTASGEYVSCPKGHGKLYQVVDPAKRPPGPKPKQRRLFNQMVRPGSLASLILELLGDRLPHHQDEIADTLDATVQAVSAAMTPLELQGSVEQMPGKWFRLPREQLAPLPEGAKRKARRAAKRPTHKRGTSQEPPPTPAPVSWLKRPAQQRRLWRNPYEEMSAAELRRFKSDWIQSYVEQLAARPEDRTDPAVLREARLAYRKLQRSRRRNAEEFDPEWWFRVLVEKFIQSGKRGMDGFVRGMKPTDLQEIAAWLMVEGRRQPANLLSSERKVRGFIEDVVVEVGSGVLEQMRGPSEELINAVLWVLRDGKLHPLAEIEEWTAAPGATVGTALSALSTNGLVAPVAPGRWELTNKGVLLVKERPPVRPNPSQHDYHQVAYASNWIWPDGTMQDCETHSIGAHERYRGLVGRDLPVTRALKDGAIRVSRVSGYYEPGKDTIVATVVQPTAAALRAFREIVETAPAGTRFSWWQWYPEMQGSNIDAAVQSKTLERVSCGEPSEMLEFLDRMPNPATTWTRTAGEGVQLGEVTLDELVLDKRCQPREGIDEKKVERIVKTFSLKRLSPLLVAQDPAGSLLLCGGWHRVEALKRLGYKQAPAQIVKVANIQEAIDLADQENQARDDLAALEQAKSWQRYLDRGMQLDAVAELVGKRPMVIRGRVGLLRLSEAMKQALRDGAIDVGLAEALADAVEKYKLDERLQWQILQHFILPYDLTKGELTRALKTLAPKMVKQASVWGTEIPRGFGSAFHEAMTAIKKLNARKRKLIAVVNDLGREEKAGRATRSLRTAARALAAEVKKLDRIVEHKLSAIGMKPAPRLRSALSRKARRPARKRPVRRERILRRLYRWLRSLAGLPTRRRNNRGAADALSVRATGPMVVYPGQFACFLLRQNTLQGRPPFDNQRAATAYADKAVSSGAAERAVVLRA